MCTAFVRKGKDVITGFNFDMDLGGIKFQPYIEADRVFLAMVFPEEVVKAMPPSVKMNNGVRLIQGVSSGGYVGGQLCNMDFEKAPTSFDPAMLTIDQLTDDFVTEKYTFEKLKSVLESRTVENIPRNPEETGGVQPLALHSLYVDPDGNIVFLEPGNGYAIIKEKYFTVTNFSILEMPLALTEERYGYYGVDRYKKSLDILKKSTDDFGVEDGLHLLNEVKQTGNWATRFSFVYSRNENKVYYCMDGDFNHVQELQF